MNKRRTIWDVDDIAFDDVPTVQDVLRAADARLLSRLVVDRIARDRWGESACADRDMRALRRRVRKAVGEMASVDPKRSKKWCVFPLRAFGADADTGVLSQEMACVLVRRTDLGGAILALDAVQPVASRGEWRDVRRDSRRSRPKGPDTYSLALTRWRALFGYRMWMGGDFTRKERYEALADFVREAMRAGCSEKDSDRFIKRERSRLRTAIGESEREGTSGRRGAPVEVVLARYGLGDYGLGTPEDALEAEQAQGAVDLACALNHNEYIDLMRRMASLARMVNRH